MTGAQHKKVFELLLTGLCIKEIAAKLNISFYTARWHASNVYREHGVQDRKELMAKFITRDTQ